MVIGGFFKGDDGKSYLGDIIGGLALFQAVEIVPAEKKGDGPDYAITTPHGELGVAWKETSRKGNEYLAVKLDSPFFTAPVHCALVKQSGTAFRGEYVLVWNRKTEKPETV